MLTSYGSRSASVFSHPPLVWIHRLWNDCERPEPKCWKSSRYKHLTTHVFCSLLFLYLAFSKSTWTAVPLYYYVFLPYYLKYIYYTIDLYVIFDALFWQLLRCLPLVPFLFVAYGNVIPQCSRLYDVYLAQASKRSHYRYRIIQWRMISTYYASRTSSVGTSLANSESGCT